MLDAETRRRIDTARDILVGKVPDPKSQVEQITIALIYKFMDDMDAESEELGGKRKFFAGDFARYGWAKLMYPGLGGHETLNLYAEAITRMPENPGVPLLFRNIFKNAYLPYRDPETLKLFLKTIDEFNYDHSERLGDAFEYLLSVLGSQGDAGQFRTPRHIIDFIVEVINPQKHETILDPACGTAGFLISSYKHILAANTMNMDTQDGQDKKEKSWVSCPSMSISTLTPDERGRLGRNLWGYDISPDMVRLSLVNLYLHGFADPRIYEYDTLTSEERWNEVADVILANPPFMSPKGGIKPHKRFSVKSKRSEVLFVDYMAEHLTPAGRAGIIVPEGVIFQSQTAYKQLRKMLVETALVAVVSLPAGVFQPYSGVKTSILILDKSRARQRDAIAFFKVENDGFGLGAQRRPIEQNDLPEVLGLLREWIDHGIHGKHGKFEGLPNVIVASKAQIAANGEYNLSGERYREAELRITDYEFVRLGEICAFEYGKALKESNRVPGDYPVFGSNGIVGFHNEYLVEAPFLVIGRKGSAGEVHYSGQNGFPIDTTFYVKLEDEDRILLKYLFHALKKLDLRSVNVQAGVPGLNRNDAYQLHIPLPPLEIQREIVAEIEGYQRVMDGARAVLDAYRPQIHVDPEWPLVELGEICSFKNGLNFGRASSGYTVKIIGVGDFQDHLYAPLRSLGEVHLNAPPTEEYLVKAGDILFVRSNGNPDLVGRSIIVPPLEEPTTFSGFTIRARIEDERALPLFYAQLFKSRDFAEGIKKVGRGANIRNLSQSILCELTIPLPPLETQRVIVAEIEAEQRLVEANRELITRFERKIEAVLARVWDN